MKPNNHSSILLAAAALAIIAAINPQNARADLPDDAVKTLYTESTGAQWIDTGIAPAFGLKFETTFCWMEPASAGTDNTLIGARTTGENDRFFPIHNTEGVMLVGAGAGGTRYPVAGNPDELTDYAGAKTGGKGVPIVEGRRYSLVAEIGSSVQTIHRDGELVHSGTLYNAFAFPTCNLYLFACNISGTAQQKSKVRIYAFKIWKDGQLKRNYIPCVQNGVAGFWEDVGQTFVGSGSDTALLAGPRGAVGEPDFYSQWMASNGSVYLDTGVPASFDCSVEGKLRFLSVDSNEHTFLGASYTGGAPRRYLMPVHLVGDKLWFAAGTGNEYGQDEVKHYAGDIDNDGNGRMAIAAGADHEFSATFENGNQSYEWDGATLYTSAVAGTTAVGYNLYLFADCQNGTAQMGAAARCYYLKISRNGTLVRDFVAGVKDGEACLYDRVAGECLFASSPLPATSGFAGPPSGTPTRPAFHLGYIGSTGLEYVNTGVEGRPGTKIAASLSWKDAQIDGIVLGSRKDDGNTRFFPLYANSRYFGYGQGTLGYLNTDAVYHRYAESGAVSVVNDTVYTVVADLGTSANEISVDGTVYYRGATSAVATGYPMYLFACNKYGTADYFSKVRIRSLEIWQDGERLRKFIPVIADNGGPYLWDSANNVFYQGAEAALWDIGPVGEAFVFGTVITFR